MHSGKAKAQQAVRDQQKWIDSCHYDTDHYQNPEAVRAADRAFMAKLVVSLMSGRPVWS